MLTRFQVNGFKNLIDVDARFGPLTCIAGANGVGKSNLFDALEFLSLLAEYQFIEAASRIRPAPARGNAFETLISESVLSGDQELSLSAEMILPPAVNDEFNQTLEPSRTMVRYEIKLGVERRGDVAGGYQPKLLHEQLSPVALTEQEKRLLTKSGVDWRERVYGRRTKPFLSWNEEGPSVHLQFDPSHAGHPRKIAVESAQRSVLSASASAEYPTLLAARQEMRSWRFIALEPSAMRAPDELMERRPVSSAGAHLPANLYRRSLTSEQEGDPYRQVRDIVGALVDVREISVHEDKANQVLELRARISDSPALPARSLSDGTLRFLALATMGVSTDYAGLICMEEPENGIHPGKMRHMANLLHHLSEPGDGGLRQIIVNSHSPAFVSRIPDGEILCAVRRAIPRPGGKSAAVDFRPLPGTWRAESGARSVSRRELKDFLHEEGA